MKDSIAENQLSMEQWLETLDAEKRYFNFEQLTGIKPIGVKLTGVTRLFVEVLGEDVAISQYLKDKRDELVYIAETHALGSFGWPADTGFEIKVNIVGRSLESKEKMLVYVESPEMWVVDENGESDSEFWSWGISFTINVVSLSSLFDHALKESVFEQHKQRVFLEKE